MDCTQKEVLSPRWASGSDLPCTDRIEPEADLIPCSPPPKLDYAMLNNRKIMEASFYIFPESPEETKNQKARAILGEIAQYLSEQELAIYLTQFQYLLDSWLDIYEKEIFNGITLQQMLREG